MLMTTTDRVEGRQIIAYYGIVTGETIMGANAVRDFVASITDFIGGRSGVYESKLSEAKDIALNEMAAQAHRMGANAVIGIDLDYEMVRDGMMMCVASGTAVRLQD